MKWTPDKVALLREYAGKSMKAREAAEIFGVALTALNDAAQHYGVRFYGNDPLRYSYDEAMERWRPLIGPMKDRLRAEVERIAAGD